MAVRTPKAQRLPKARASKNLFGFPGVSVVAALSGSLGPRVQVIAPRTASIAAVGAWPLEAPTWTSLRPRIERRAPGGGHPGGGHPPRPEAKACRGSAPRQARGAST